MFASDFSHNENMFNVHSIEYLLFILKNAVTEHAWPALSLSAEEIQRDVYDFTLDIACEVKHFCFLLNGCYTSTKN